LLQGTGAERAFLAAAAALFVFALLLALAGKGPLKAYGDTLIYIFGNSCGFSELLVRAVPLLLTATAAALPARLGLINVGGEGQLYKSPLRDWGRNCVSRKLSIHPQPG
jgi:general nucleoside transport system permease protein